MKRCVAEINCETEFYRRIGELYDLNSNATTSEDILDMKIILSQEYIPYEEYKKLTDVITDIKDSIQLEQYDIETKLFNDMSCIREKRRLDNIRLIFVKTKLRTDCVNKIVEYIFNPVICRSNEHNKRQYNLQSNMCRIWRKTQYDFLIKKRLYYIMNGTHERKRNSHSKMLNLA